MTKKIISIIGTVAIITFNGIIEADDAVKKQIIIPSVVETGPVVFPIPRPTLTKTEFCTRTEYPTNIRVSVASTAEIIDGPIPLHCLEPNCGLGVYSKGSKEDTVERCSYCNAVKPEKA